MKIIEIPNMYNDNYEKEVRRRKMEDKKRRKQGHLKKKKGKGKNYEKKD